MMKGFENTRAIIFDMDGTLLDSMWAWRGENRVFLKRHGCDAPEDIAKGLDTLSSRAFAKRMTEEYPGVFTIEGIMAEYLDSMCAHYKTDVFPKKGAERFLKMLKEKGIKMCVATATPRGIAKEALALNGLSEYFDFITDDVEMGVAKSDPKFFEAAAKRLGVSKDEMALFEDSLYAMLSGKKAGLSIFAIEENVHVGYEELMKCIKETADVFVKDFDEACEVFFG